MHQQFAAMRERRPRMASQPRMQTSLLHERRDYFRALGRERQERLLVESHAAVQIQRVTRGSMTRLRLRRARSAAGKRGGDEEEDAPRPKRATASERTALRSALRSLVQGTVTFVREASEADSERALPEWKRAARRKKRRARERAAERAARDRAARVLQRAARGFLARRAFDALLRRWVDDNRWMAAQHVQAWYRGARTRAQLFAAARSERETAAVRVQRLLRGRLGRVRAELQRRAVQRRLAQARSALLIQRWARGHRARAIAGGKRREHAAVCIQRHARGYCARRRTERDREAAEAAATVLAAAERGRIDRIRAAELRAARDKRRAAERHVVETAASTAIQRAARGCLVRHGSIGAASRRLRARRAGAAATLQRCYRGHAGRRVASQLRMERQQRIAATRIAAAERGRRGRRAAREERGARDIQRIVRGHLGRCEAKRRRQARLDRARNLAATRIQCAVRCSIARWTTRAQRVARLAALQQVPDEQERPRPCRRVP